LPSSTSTTLKLRSPDIQDTTVTLGMADAPPVYTIETGKLLRHTVIREGGVEGNVVAHIDRHTFGEDKVKFEGHNAPK